jgi:hypothetical protein
MLKISALFVLVFIASCALSGRSNDNGVIKYISGAAKVSDVEDVHLINLVRAIGVPNNSLVLGKFKYYQWDYSKLIGVNTILGGGSTTFYCKMSAETQNNKVKALSWYGNQCDLYLDQIRDYFKDKLKIASPIDAEINPDPQNSAPKVSEISTYPKVAPVDQKPVSAANVAMPAAENKAHEDSKLAAPLN